MSNISVNTLSCGARVVIEPIDGVRSAAVTWLVPIGDAFDPSDRMGRAAMYSELLVRGAGDLDSRAQADAFDAIGASRSVNNSRVFVRVSSSMLGERIGDAMGLIADIVRRPRMDEVSIEPSRELCLQALASLADEPQHRAKLAARDRHYPSPLNRTGYGDESGLKALTGDELKSAWAESATAGGSIIAVAGSVDRDAVIERAEALTSDWGGHSTEPAIGAPAPRGYAHQEDDSEQVQLIMVHDGPKESDEHSMKERLLVSVLSGGMSSRLFSEVREKRGLCYAVSASYAADRDFGTITAYVGTTPDKAQEAIDVLHAEMTAVGKSKPIVQEEFDRAVAGMKSRLIFSGESTAARAGAVASDLYRVGRPRSLDEMARAVDAVSLDDLNAYAAAREIGKATIQTLGKASVTPPV